MRTLFSRRSCIISGLAAALAYFNLESQTSDTTTDVPGSKIGWEEGILAPVTPPADPETPVSPGGPVWILGKNIWYDLASTGSGHAYSFTVPSEERYTDTTVTNWSTQKTVTLYATTADGATLGTIWSAQIAHQMYLEYLIATLPPDYPTTPMGPSELSVNQSLIVTPTPGNYAGPIFRLKYRMDYTFAMTCSRTPAAMYPHLDGFSFSAPALTP